MCVLGGGGWGGAGGLVGKDASSGVDRVGQRRVGRRADRGVEEEEEEEEEEDNADVPATVSQQVAPWLTSTGHLCARSRGPRLAQLQRAAESGRVAWILPAWETHKRLGLEEGGHVADTAIAGEVWEVWWCGGGEVWWWGGGVVGRWGGRRTWGNVG